MRGFIQSGLVLLILLASAAWYYVMQPQVSVADGKGWDGVAYHQMYLHYKSGTTPAVYDAPFNKRVGLPWLAAQLPLDETQAFRMINIGCGLIGCLLVYLTLRGRFTNGVIFACMGFASCHVFSPIRFPDFYPFTVDPPAFMLYALAALLISRSLYVFAGLALASSVLFKESGVYLAVALGATIGWHDRGLRKAGLVIGLFALAGALAMSAFQLPGGKYSQLITVLYYAKHKLLDPLELLRAISCLGMTLTPFLLCKARGPADGISDDDLEIRLARSCMLLGVAMALFGGSDTTRIFFMTYPLYVVLLAHWASEADGLTLALAAGAGMAANRFLASIPQPAAEWPNHDVSGYYAIVPDYAHAGVVASFAAFWAFWWFLLAGPGRPALDQLVVNLIRRKPDGQT